MSSVSHHYNPRVYLRQFTNPKAKNELWEYNLKTGAARKSSPKESGCQDYYNSVALEDGGRDDDAIETAFHPLENALPKLFEAIRNNTMTIELWHLFFTFAAIQDARSPATVDAIDEFLGRVYQASFEMLCKGSSKFKNEIFSLGLDPHKIPDDLEMKASQGSALLLSLEATISKTAEILRMMKWCFIYAPAGKFFFTSDHPICRWTPREKRNIYSGGLTNQNIEITFPLMRRVCACGHWTMAQPENDSEISSKVDTINCRTVQNARNFVYGPTMDAGIAELVQEKFKKRQSSCQPIETK